VIEHEGQNELLDKAESVEIAEAANLIEQNLLVSTKKIERLYARQRLGHERFSEIEAFVAADNVLNSPVCLYGRRQSFLIVVLSREHNPSIQSVTSKHCGTAALQLESCAATAGQTMLVRPKKLTQRPTGSEAVLAKMSEALFVDTLRRYLAGLPKEEVGWLAAARDLIIGRSLMLLHSQTAHPWTIAELAKQVGSSRSGLMERFTRYLAEPPMSYLIRWRLQLAARALGSTSRGVADIAEEVGYEAEAAFNRAFKREFGSPPARYRREQRAARI
jgi:AraC-like DNA-binding protein